MLRAEFHSDLTGAALLQQLKQTAMAAQMHQDLPFEQLVDALQPQRNLSHSPLFQAMFNHRNETDTALTTALPDLAIEPMGWAQRTAQFDLSLDTSDSAQGLHAALTYATDLFEPATIERMGQHWLNLLQGLVQDLHRPVAQWALLDADERRRMLVEWNTTAVQYPLDRSVHSLIEEQVSRTPDAPALVFGEQRLTYTELNARANRLAHRLIDQGVGPDVLVGIAVERSVEMVLGLLAILKAGGAYVPLDPEYPRDRLAYMFDDSGIGLLLTQRHLLDALPVPEAIRCLVLDQPEDGLQAGRDANPCVDVDAENLAYVIYTSGSTGKPKGAGNRHSALVNRLCWMQQAYGLDATDSVLQKNAFQFRRIGVGVLLAAADRRDAGGGRAGRSSRPDATDRADHRAAHHHVALRAVDVAGVCARPTRGPMHQPEADRVQRRSPAGGCAAAGVRQTAERQPVQPLRSDRGSHRRHPLDLCPGRSRQRADRPADCQPGYLHPGR
nr:hypothetical protein GCM10020185_60230 [Pseudomonas brassicacearum subsp. brassicacearum]